MVRTYVTRLAHHNSHVVNCVRSSSHICTAHVWYNGSFFLFSDKNRVSTAAHTVVVVSRPKYEKLCSNANYAFFIDSGSWIKKKIFWKKKHRIWHGASRPLRLLHTLGIYDALHGRHTSCLRNDTPVAWLNFKSHNNLRVRLYMSLSYYKRGHFLYEFECPILSLHRPVTGEGT